MRVHLTRFRKSFVNTFTANDPALQKAAETYHAEYPGNDLQNEIDAKMYQYIGKALKSS